MCGRYSITSPVAALRRVFAFEGPLPNLGPSYNVAPTRAVPIIIADEGARRLTFARWGLVPSWAKEIAAPPLINARAETVADKPAFRSAFKRRHCLVPADGFFEWQAQPSGPKQPYNIVVGEGGPFGMAGIWETWMAPDGGELVSMAIITTKASARLAPIHDRMPVVVLPADYALWLDPKERAREDAEDIFARAQHVDFRPYRVSRRVNAVANDDPDVIAPEGQSQLPL